MSYESLRMKTLRKFGFERLAWALRRLDVPVDKSALVLEVGSGGNPYPRSDILLDAYEETRERHWEKLATDRPTVLGFVENLPFKDNAFDFVIAAHVLEHSKDPDKFIQEIQRVAKSGYIEVPDAFFERLNPYKDHRLEITVRNDVLQIYKKKSWQQDNYLLDLFEDRVQSFFSKEVIAKHPFDFHVRFYWDNNIKYKILNPEENIDWPSPESSVENPSSSLKVLVKKSLRNFIHRNQKVRNKFSPEQILNLLRCINCHGEDLTQKGELVVCNDCEAEYAMKGIVYAMNGLSV